MAFRPQCTYQRPHCTESCNWICSNVPVQWDCRCLSRSREPVWKRRASILMNLICSSQWLPPGYSCCVLALREPVPGALNTDDNGHEMSKTKTFSLYYVECHDLISRSWYKVHWPINTRRWCFRQRSRMDQDQTTAYMISSSVTMSFKTCYSTAPSCTSPLLLLDGIRPWWHGPKWVCIS